MATKRTIADEAQAAGPETATAAAPQERQPGEEPGAEPEQPRKKWTPGPNPHGIEGIRAGTNVIHLLKEEPDRKTDFPGAWVIRFDKSPNEGVDATGKPYGKENPHPVLAYLKGEGYHWGFSDADGKGGWGKLWEDGQYRFEEHMDARRVLQQTAEMIGAQIEKGTGVPF
jgi:hypothetical protein